MIKMLAEKSVDEERPPEPYPGFYNDMLRAGLSEEQARDKASKTSGQKGSQSQEQPKTVGKKSLVGPDGKPLAPWMKVEDAPERSPIRSRSDARGRLAADPQQQGAFLAKSRAYQASVDLHFDVITGTILEF